MLSILSNPLRKVSGYFPLADGMPRPVRMPCSKRCGAFAVLSCSICGSRCCNICATSYREGAFLAHAMQHVPFRPLRKSGIARNFCRGGLHPEKNRAVCQDCITMYLRDARPMRHAEESIPTHP